MIAFALLFLLTVCQCQRVYIKAISTWTVPSYRSFDIAHGGGRIVFSFGRTVHVRMLLSNDSLTDDVYDLSKIATGTYLESQVCAGT